MRKNQAQNGQDQYAQTENGQANQNGRCENSVHHLAIHPIVGVGGSAGEGGPCTVGSGGTRTVIHFCISKTEHCIRTPHASVIFDGVIVAVNVSLSPSVNVVALLLRLTFSTSTVVVSLSVNALIIKLPPYDLLLKSFQPL